MTILIKKHKNLEQQLKLIKLLYYENLKYIYLGNKYIHLKCK